MCGIAGIVSADRRDHDDMTKVLVALGHRGPDDEGVYSQPSVTLGHCRLSIIDLSPAGHQPMQSRDGRFVLTFNGEIYNYIELAEELARLGWEFAGHSDTEVLLAAWGQWGAGCLSRLVGMFAFAVLDNAARQVSLVRDPFGIKPLFVSSHPRCCVFASEIGALLEHRCVGRTLDPMAAYDYLRWGLTDHSDRTHFSDVRQLRPGEIGVVDLDRPGTIDVHSYWSMPSEEVDISFEDAAEQLRETFLRSIELHLRSDVPVGAALSGGIDSSAIVSAMRAVAGPHLELHAFSYVSDDAQSNEERYLDLAAQRSGAIVHRVHTTSADLELELDSLIRSQGEPFGGTSLLAQRQVFAAAAEQGVTVLLDGQGADELFGGYRSFLAQRFAALVRRGALISAARLARSVAGLPDVALDRQTVAAVASTVGPQWLRRRAERAAGREPFPGWCNERWFRDRGVDGSRRAVGGDLASAFSNTSLPSLLRYEDRSSMAYSLESRVPFLTSPLVEQVFALPRQHLVSTNGTTKLVFREAMRGIVPDPILDRRDKIGFTTPEDRWLRDKRSMLEGTLHRLARRGDGPLDMAACTALVDAAAAPGRLDAHRLWRWVNFARWVELFDVDF